MIDVETSTLLARECTCACTFTEESLILVSSQLNYIQAKIRTTADKFR